ncbi:MAG TPA: hypothetical protein VGB65_04205 [Allosphingosinicella sp.]
MNSRDTERLFGFRGAAALKPGERAFQLDSPQARRLADLTGVQADLARVEHCCRIILTRREAESQAAVRVAAFDSALMRYRRCFNSGPRHGLSSKHVKRLEPRLQETHQLVVDMANRAIAHCASGYEDNRTYIAVRLAAGKVEMRLGVMHQAVLHLATARVAALAELACALREAARSEADGIAFTLEAEVKMYDEAAIKGLVPVEPVLDADGEPMHADYRTGTGSRR